MKTKLEHNKGHSEFRVWDFFLSCGHCGTGTGPGFVTQINKAGTGSLVTVHEPFFARWGQTLVVPKATSAWTSVYLSVK